MKLIVSDIDCVDSDGLYVFRLVFMNIWFDSINEKGISYRDDFINILKKTAISYL